MQGSEIVKQAYLLTQAHGGSQIKRAKRVEEFFYRKIIQAQLDQQTLQLPVFSFKSFGQLGHDEIHACRSR